MSSLEIDSLLNQLASTQTNILRQKGIASIHKDNIAVMSNESDRLNKAICLNSESKELYKQATDLIYSKSIGELENTINKGLSTIFYDKDFQIKFELGDRVNKTLNVYLVDNQKDLIVNMKSGVGAGVRSVVSFVLLVFYILNKKSFPIIFLDESYSEISKAYIENFFNFIKYLCESKGLHLIMVTHDDRFINYSDKVYTISDGFIVNESDN
jgi:DNA repair exonuclease SbcCD ATPase subunit